MAKKKRKHYTDSEIVLIRQMIVNGDSNKKIARETGRQVRALPYFKVKYASDLDSVQSRCRTKRTTRSNFTIKTKDSAALVDLIINANVPKDQKIKCLEALL